MSDLILDEYVKVTRTIENIQDKIIRYKKSVEENIENSKSEKEQEQKIKEFQKTMSRIKGDNDITKRYRLLKQKQKELRDKLIPDAISLSEADLLIINLRKKYEALAKNKVLLIDDEELDNIELDTKRSLQNIKFDMILQQVQKNLKHEDLKYNAEKFDMKSME